ncbi:MAG: endonuclease III domain-containing protein [Candidatus Micrarchaeota archaeon]
MGRAMKIYRRLYARFGAQGWWPTYNSRSGRIEYRRGKFRKLAEPEKLEIAIGAILAQNTNWKNAEKAVVGLIKRNKMNVSKIAEMNESDLGKIIRPSGYFRQKAHRLKIFCSHLLKNYGGKIGKMYEKEIRELRCELLSLHGIGPETADSIILYSAQKPSFVIDAYTFRLNDELKLLKLESKTHHKRYGELKSYFERSLPPDVRLFQEYHALIVEWGKRNPKARVKN